MAIYNSFIVELLNEVKVRIKYLNNSIFHDFGPVQKSKENEFDDSLLRNKDFIN